MGDKKILIKNGDNFISNKVKMEHVDTMYENEVMQGIHNYEYINLKEAITSVNRHEIKIEDCCERDYDLKSKHGNKMDDEKILEESFINSEDSFILNKVKMEPIDIMNENEVKKEIYDYEYVDVKEVNSSLNVENIRREIKMEDNSENDYNLRSEHSGIFEETNKMDDEKISGKIPIKYEGNLIPNKVKMEHTDTLNENEVNEEIYNYDYINLNEVSTSVNLKSIHDKIKIEDCSERDYDLISKRSGTLIEHSEKDPITCSSEKPLNFSTCFETFANSESTSYKRKSFNEEVNLSRLNTHRIIDTQNKTYKCDTCFKTFSTLGNLNAHTKLHTGEKPYKCNTCSKTFMYLCALKAHARIHTGEKPYKCTKCSMTFAHLCSLKNHTNKIHTGEYKCNICFKTFVNSSSLSSHINTHSDEKPHKCNICAKTFSSSSNLNSHIKIHSGEKPQCNICFRTFTHSTNLRTHMKIHTGEKAYKCNICLKAFTHSNSLKNHIKLHTGEKPYKCNACLKTFTSLAHLNYHESIHCDNKLNTSFETQLK